MSFGIPKKIVCLTEESVELLYLLGCEDLIVGVSSYVKRPQEAQRLPKTSVFTHANVEKIKEIDPDFVIGFSDIQKDIAKDLIAQGLDVWISNQRSSEEIFDYTIRLASLVGKRKEGIELTERFRKNIENAQTIGAKFSQHPKVYIEEWDEPMISGIKWFSEVVEFCGGKNIFSKKADSSLAMDRVVTIEEVASENPDIVLASWCGKKFDSKAFEKRFVGKNIQAIKDSQVHELEAEIFLQPGPAPYIDGLEILTRLFQSWQS